MRLWRISDFTDLRGEGGLFASGRWHTRGHRIVYLADHPASALLEVLVHLEVVIDDVPANYHLLAVEVPDDVVSRAESVTTSLPDGWMEDISVSRKLGDDWLISQRCALLGVPSAIVPYTTNWLLNPRHADADAIRIIETIHGVLDPRLLRKR